jgi:hypothetical protein
VLQQELFKLINVTGGTVLINIVLMELLFKWYFTNLSAGTYVVTIRDFNNCTATTTPITLVQPLRQIDFTFYCL